MNEDTGSSDDSSYDATRFSGLTRTMSSGFQPGTESELTSLRAQVRSTRTVRQADQRSLTGAATIESAIAAAERDIDTRTTGPVTRARERARELTNKLTDCWASIDWYRLVLQRIAAHGFAIEVLPHREQSWRRWTPNGSPARRSCSSLSTPASVCVCLRPSCPSNRSIRREIGSLSGTATSPPRRTGATRPVRGRVGNVRRIRMPRGKHRKSSAGRGAQALADAIAVARAELHAEESLLATTREEVDAMSGRALLLEQLHAEQFAASLPEATWLNGQIEALQAALEVETVHYDKIQHQWERFSSGLLEFFGGGIDAQEMLMEVLSGRRITVVGNRKPQGMSRASARALQYVRGERGTIDPRYLIKPKRHPLADVLPAGLAARLADALNDADPASRRNLPADAAAGERPNATVEGAPGTDGSTVTESDADNDWISWVRLPGVTDATWATMTTDAITAWHPMPWLIDPLWTVDSDVGTALGVPRPPHPNLNPETGGAVRSQTVAAVPVPVPAMAQAVRDGLASADVRVVIEAWSPRLATAGRSRRAQVLAHPLARWPAQPSATVAASVAHWYTLAGLGTWARAQAAHDARATDFGRTAIAAAAAAPFWLPPAQTADFFDSEPLTDFDDLRLPFPQVLLTFAEPPELPAGDPEIATALGPALGVLDGALLTERIHLGDGPPYWALSSAAVNLFDEPFTASVADSIAARGARVEAMLLMSDSLGRLAPQMAWALAVPAANGGVLARVFVPARWADSAWRDQVLNAAAVCAWADWHAPDEPVEPNPRDVSPGPGTLAGAGADGVYVLAVRATRANAGRTEPTGRQIAAHVRRGHWRRQHHGPLGELVKRVRIAPTLVNASRSELGTRIYRLPAPGRQDPRK